ncbi:unnamed protein product, partial [marine sediment metagenome]
IQFNNEYNFHSEWEELDQGEALKIFQIIKKLEDGEISLEIAQAEFFMHVSGISIPEEKHEGIFWENLYQAARMFRFFFCYKYEDERFKHLSEETRSMLAKHLPDELSQTPEIKVAAKMKPGFKIDCVFGKNLIESVRIDKKVYPGYRFINQNWFISTTLSSAQYVEALAVSNKYAIDRTDEDLDLLTSILHCKGEFVSETAFEKKNIFEKLNVDNKYAIWRNFRAICTWLSTRTHFSILWAGKPSGKKQDETVGDIIYSVSKAGYGTPDQVGKMNLMKLLEIMKKMIVDNILSMKQANIKPL